MQQRRLLATARSTGVHVLVVLLHLHIAFADRQFTMRNEIDVVSLIVRFVWIVDEVSRLLNVGRNHLLQILTHLLGAEHVLSGVPFDVPGEAESDMVRMSFSDLISWRLYRGEFH